MGAGDEDFPVVDPDSFPAALYTTLGPGLVQQGPLHTRKPLQKKGVGVYVVENTKSPILNQLICPFRYLKSMRVLGDKLNFLVNYQNGGKTYQLMSNFSSFLHNLEELLKIYIPGVKTEG